MTPGGEISFRIDEPVVLVGAVTFVLWVVVERFLQFLRLSQPLTSERERVSWYWFVVTYYGAFIFPFFDATTLHWSTVGPNLAPARWLGVPLLVAGFGIRTLARLTLGKHFSGYVQTTSEHRLITTGIYGWIRHPAYLGYIFLLFGFPICFGSVGGLGWAIVSGIPTLVYRIRIEEARWEDGFRANTSITDLGTGFFLDCGRRSVLGVVRGPMEEVNEPGRVRGGGRACGFGPPPLGSYRGKAR